MIYEVTVQIAQQREQEWLLWIARHITAILETGCFTHADLQCVEDALLANPTYIIRYHCNNPADYQRYLTNHAPAFRTDGIDRFGADLTTSRRVLRTIPFTEN